MTGHGLALIALRDSLLASVIEELPPAQRRAVLRGRVPADVAVMLDACCDPGWRKRLADALAHSQPGGLHDA